MPEFFKPSNVQQVQEIVQWALSGDEKLNVVGSGSKAHLDNVSAESRNDEHRVDMTALSGITQYDPDEMVLCARAGTPMTEILEAVTAAGQQLGFEPLVSGPFLKGDGAVLGTLAGVVSSNFAGPRRLTAGSVRDHVLGYDAVSGRGEIYKAGGRVVKNVTGYDLMKLVCGSYGTVSLLTDIVIKTQPGFKTEQSLFMGAQTPEEAVELMTRALGSAFAVSSAAAVPASGFRGELPLSVPWVAVARLEGHEAAVRERTERLSGLILSGGQKTELHVSDEARSKAFWAAVGQSGLELGRTDGLWKISVAPSKGARLMRSLLVDRPELDFTMDWGGGLIWVRVPETYDFGDCAAALREEVEDFGGHATLWVQPEDYDHETPVFHPLSPAEELLSKRIKASFDPECILNTGRMFHHFKA
ncbi:FAD-binding protein [Kiloniella sp. b19]|uniref:FAD-binding protein n=1 Tax=Kiloniella sp. GXU_MW_B19 TaxID=3141326 RepID=UPI0031D6700C